MSSPAGTQVVTAAPRVRQTPARAGGGTRPGADADPVSLGLAWAVGGAFGLSCLFRGYYGLDVWGPLGFVLAAVLVAVVVSSPLRLRGPALVAVTSLTALTAWSAISMTWAESVDRAWTETNRLGFYLVVLLLGLCIARSKRAARALVGVLAFCGAAVVAITVARMLLSGGPDLFVGGRLGKPMGYINGEAGFLLIVFWCLAAVAERRGRPAVRGAAMAAAVMALELLVLTQARAIVPALLASIVLVLVVAPGRLARGCLLLLGALSAAAALPALLDIYAGRGSGLRAFVDATSVHRAALAMIATALMAGAVWALATVMRARVTRRGPRRALACALIAVPVLTSVVSLSIAHDPGGWVSREYRAFVSLKQPTGDARTRFTDVGGFRYDLWRIAVREWRDAPVKGLGAGNYDTRYYRLRKNPQYVRQPHSLELQSLAELGLPGGVGLLAVIGAVAWGGLRRAVRRHDSLAVAGLAGTTVWLVHTSVDWLYNLPGVTGIAILLAAVLLRDPVAEPPSPSVHRSTAPVLATTAAVLVAVALLTVSTAQQYLALRHSHKAFSLVAKAPGSAVAEARKARGLNSFAVDAYYIEAAALSRLHRYEAARATLLAAADREPSNYVTWTLLGDLAMRRGDRGQARLAYARARRLSPRDPLSAAPAGTADSRRTA